MKQVGVSLKPEMIAAVDEWRSRQPFAPSRSAALSALIVMALKIVSDADQGELPLAKRHGA